MFNLRITNMLLPILLFLPGCWQEDSSHLVTVKEVKMNYHFKIIDLTHEFTTTMPTWDGTPGFEITTILDYHHSQSGTKFKTEAIQFNKAGTGTHIDSPSHSFSGKRTVAELPLDTLVVPACVINLSSKLSPKYVVSVEDIKMFEKEHGIIEPNSLVIIHTGWSRYWHDAQQYRNENEQGIMRYPSISLDAAQYLLDRDIAGIAIDTLSPDLPDSGYPVHDLMLSHDKYIIENIAHADQLPSTGALVVALPLKMHITESMVRVIGLICE